MWSCIQWSFGGNRLTGLNGLSVILPRVMHISTEENDKGDTRGRRATLVLRSEIERK
jgi:hypothetical protein